MDTHRNVEGLTTEAVEGAHQADLATQKKYGVDYKQYWYNEAERTVWLPTTSSRSTRATEIGD
jgi:hypothetical protein